MLKQVLAVGNFVSSFTSILDIVKGGSRYLNPIRGGLGQDVTNLRTKDCSWGLSSFITFQKYFTVEEDLENPPIYFVEFAHSTILID